MFNPKSNTERRYNVVSTRTVAFLCVLSALSVLCGCSRIGYEVIAPGDVLDEESARDGAETEISTVHDGFDVVDAMGLDVPDVTDALDVAVPPDMLSIDVIDVTVDVTPDVIAMDASDAPDAARCTANSCSDGVFCNGSEMCSTTTGACTPAVSGPCGSSRCDEIGQRCISAVAQTVAMGSTFGCALRPDGNVRCAGDATSGQIGRFTTPSYTPIAIASLSNVVDLVGGFNTGCARDSAGALRCWGANEDGILLDGTQADRAVPQLLPGLSGVRSVAVAGLPRVVNGEGLFLCVARSTGDVLCWGSNTRGQLGDGTVVSKTTPTVVPMLSDVIQVVGGPDFACALQRTGTVRCWGRNDTGQLGNGNMTDSLSPIAVVGLSDAMDLSAGTAHICATRRNGTVVCWGANWHGQTGGGACCAAQLTPGAVTGLLDAQAVSVGHTFSCALRSTGTVRCWGHGTGGQLGDGNMAVDQPVPVEVQNLANVVQISAHGDAACAALSTGSIMCWGSNPLGNLGTGDRVTQFTAVPGY